MRHIPVPFDVQLRNMETGEASEFVSFRKHAFAFWLNDPRGVKDATTTRRWLKVIDKFESITKDPSEKWKGSRPVLSFEDEDWRLLKDIVEKPENQRPGLFAVQFLPYVDAVVNAYEKLGDAEAAAAIPAPDAS